MRGDPPPWKMRRFPYWLIPERLWCWGCFGVTRWIDEQKMNDPGYEPENLLGASRAAILCAWNERRRGRTDDE